MSNLVTKTKIKDAFRELTSQSSFAKVKVADIIAKAGISRMTFYRYYLDKYHLLEETLYDDFTRFENIYGKNVTWKDMVMSILYVICNNKPFYKKILEDSEAKEYYFETSRRISYQYTGDTAENGTYIAWKARSANGLRITSGKPRKRCTALWYPTCPFERFYPGRNWSGQFKSMKAQLWKILSIGIKKVKQ